MRQEREAFSESFFDQARRTLTEALPLAALELTRLAQNGDTDKIRLDAAKYLIDRGLGPIAQSYLASAGKIDDPIKELLANVVDEYSETS